MVLIFDGKRNGIIDDNFKAKLIGKKSKGELLFCYARLPGIEYLQAALSPGLPKITLEICLGILPMTQLNKERTSDEINKETLYHNTIRIKLL